MGKKTDRERRRRGCRKRMMGWDGGGDSAGVQEEEIQLNNTGSECIFNQAASFPDVGASLCVRL